MSTVVMSIWCAYTDLYSMCNNFGDTASNESQFRSEDYVVTADGKFALGSRWTCVRFWFATERVAAVAGDAVAAAAAVDGVGLAAVGVSIAVVVELVGGDFVSPVVDSSNALLSVFRYPLRNQMKERTNI